MDSLKILSWFKVFKVTEDLEQFIKERKLKKNISDQIKMGLRYIFADSTDHPFTITFKLKQ